METLGGLITLKLELSGEVTVNMGVPQFEPQKIPFIAKERALTYMLDINNKQIEVSVLSMGNPSRGANSFKYK